MRCVHGSGWLRTVERLCVLGGPPQSDPRPLTIIQCILNAHTGRYNQNPVATVFTFFQNEEVRRATRHARARPPPRCVCAPRARRTRFH